MHTMARGPWKTAKTLSGHLMPRERYRSNPANWTGGRLEVLERPALRAGPVPAPSTLLAEGPPAWGWRPWSGGGELLTFCTITVRVHYKVRNIFVARKTSGGPGGAKFFSR